MPGYDFREDNRRHRADIEWPFNSCTFARGARRRQYPSRSLRTRFINFTGTTLTMVHRELIIKLAAQHRLPAVYALPLFANAGGLVSYGPDSIDPYRRAAGYVDRILKGEKPADLPCRRR